MSTRIGLFNPYFDHETVREYELREHFLFGIWSDAILWKTRSFLLSVMPFAAAMTVPMKEYVITADPILKDVRLELWDTVKWDRTNVPLGLRTKFGRESMTVIDICMVSDDVLISIAVDGNKRTIPDVPFSKLPIAQITAQRSDGTCFIAPNYFFERVR